MAEYDTIVGKLIHLVNWSRPDIANAVKSSTIRHRKFVDKIIDYLASTPKRG